MTEKLFETARRGLPERRHHLRQIPRRLACQLRGRQDAAHRAAQRPLAQKHALVAAQRSLAPLAEAAADFDALIAKMNTLRTARAWVYKEQLRDILAHIASTLCNVPPIVGALLMTACRV